MPRTVPNQRIIKIHRERASYDFLGIKNENWMQASRTLGAHALRLYLYLASNRDNYDLAISPSALEAQIGMPRSTYHDQFRKLINFGYLVQRTGNIYDFYETPQNSSRSNEAIEEMNFENNTDYGHDTTAIVNCNPSEDIEINKTNIINSVQNEKQVSHSVANYYEF